MYFSEWKRLPDLPSGYYASNQAFRVDAGIVTPAYANNTFRTGVLLLKEGASNWEFFPFPFCYASSGMFVDPITGYCYANAVNSNLVSAENFCQMFVCKTFEGAPNWIRIGAAPNYPAPLNSSQSILNGSVVANPLAFASSMQYNINNTSVIRIEPPKPWLGWTTYANAVSPVTFLDTIIIPTAKTPGGVLFPCALSKKVNDTTWKNAGPVIPTVGHRANVAAREDGWIISCGGGSAAINDSTTAVTDVWVARIENGSWIKWTKVGDLPVATRSGGVIFDYNGDVTFVGGVPSGIGGTDYLNFNRQVWRAKFLP